MTKDEKEDENQRLEIVRWQDELLGHFVAYEKTDGLQPEHSASRIQRLLWAFEKAEENR